MTTTTLGAGAFTIGAFCVVSTFLSSTAIIITAGDVDVDDTDEILVLAVILLSLIVGVGSNENATRENNDDAVGFRSSVRSMPSRKGFRCG